jgi:hypothetical protein
VRIRTLVRTSSALPALPLGIGLVVFYYSQNTAQQIDSWPYPWAPTLVEQPIGLMYSITYALVCAASAWQGARLKEAGVWHTAPYQPLWRIIATALAPLVAVGWLMFLIPVTMAFVQRPVIPTWSSLPPLFLGMLLCVAHALIGFTVGQWVKPLIAAPLLLSVVFVAVGFPRAMEPMFLRHMSGEYFAQLGFGESATLSSMVAAFLPTASIAVAAAISWTRLRIAARALLAVTVVTAATLSSYTIVKDWGANPAIAVDGGTTICEGAAPRVCMPEQASDRITAVSAEVDRTYKVLRRYSVVDTAPRTIRDTVMYGRFTPRGTRTTRYLPLSLADARHTLTAAIVGPAVSFPCEAPAPKSIHTISLWLEKKLGKTSTYEQIRAEDPYYSLTEHQEIVKTVDSVSAESDAAQAAWYRDTLTAACRGQQ